MIRRLMWIRTGAVLVTILAAAMSLACGGGGGGSSGPSGLVASFNPANTNPPDQSVAMADGGSSGELFSVDIMVKGINDLAGVAFALRFNTATASFTGSDATGSVLEEAGVTLDVEARASTSDPGVILVVVSRQGSGLAGVDVVGSARLITLSFRAISATANNSFQFDTTAGERIVSTCSAGGAACTDLTEPPLTWFGGTMSAN